MLAGTILAFASAVEYWRASRAWKATQEDIRKRGEPLSFSELTGPLPPPEQNFAEIPMLHGLFDYRDTVDSKGQTVFKWTGQKVQSRVTESFRMPPEPRKKTKDRNSEVLKTTGADLESLAASFRGTNTYDRQVFGENDEGRWEKHVPYDFPRPPEDMEPAKAVLMALDSRKGALEEIASGVRRPRAQFAPRYDDGALTLLPHLSMLKSMATMYKARSAARLASADNVGAGEDVESILYLGDRLGEENTLIGFLVRIAVDTIGAGAFWSGATAHAWNDEQLAAFQKRFDSMEYKTALIRGFRGERLFGMVTMENLISDRRHLEKIFDEDGNNSLMHFIPSFWLRQNQVLHSQLLDRSVEIFQGSRADRTISSQNLPDIFDDFVKTSRRSPYNIMVHLLVPGLSKATDKADRALVVSKLAACVCALERHRLATGDYPKALSDLAPRFVKETPVDPENGQPFHYVLNTDGTFTLYSVGPDQKDDGAPGDRTGYGKNQLVDWVWPPAYPTENIRLF